MKIVRISINNFRAIKFADISGPVDDIWTFTGQNNAGKSSLFQAIRAFYGEYDINIEDFCRSSLPEAPIEITIEYVLEDEEFSELPEYYKLPGNKLRVISRFTKQKIKGSWHGFEAKDNNIVEKEDEFFGQKNVLIGKLGEVIYIPAIKDLSEELKNTKSSIFTKLITRIISETLTDLPSWNGLLQQAHNFAQDLRSPVKNTGDNELKSVNEIENRLGELLGSWQITPQITITPPTPEDIILSGAKLKFVGKQTGDEESPLKMGSGAQRSIVNSLLMLWSQIESKKAKTEKKKFSAKLTLLLYEEPEALLHYDQIKHLALQLEKIATAKSSQVMACTHSPDFISTKKRSLSSIVRLIKDKNETKFYKPSKQFIEDLLASQNDFDFILWLNSDRNIMFFVDKVILVEGTTDKAFLNFIIAQNNIIGNLYIVDCGYKSNIPKFMKLCSEFGICHLVMHDLDDEQKSKHRQWNADITAAKTSFTKCIKVIKPELEKYIGFEETNSKPITMLSQMREGKLKDNYLFEFITFIQN